MERDQEYERVISQYYGEEQVLALIMLKIDTKQAEAIAKEVSTFEIVEDLFMVTGEVDLILKARFENYTAMKTFVLDKLAPIQGIKDTKTMMVVTPFKERGERLVTE